MHRTSKDLQHALKQSFLGFIAEHFPFVFHHKAEDIQKMFSELSPNSDLEAFGRVLSAKLLSKIPAAQLLQIESTPSVFIKARLEHESSRFTKSIEGFFRREKLKQSITNEQKRSILKGIILTRTVDLTLKKIFLSSEIKYKDVGFQGKGFRSLGQEAIYAASLFLQKGDVVAPLIRDLGIALAFTDDDVVTALNAQAGKEGLPTNGRDLHVGDFSKGVWPPAAPLGISTCSVVGLAQAFKLRNEDRVAVSFIGEGGSSLGEWHEAINFAASQNLPVIFCVQNNQTALSTKVNDQSAVRTFADKAIGYGIPGITVDGTNPEDIAVSFGWAREQARDKKGPTLIELVSMRMCGHAHHDDMLYLGQEPVSSLEYQLPHPNGYVDKERFAYWASKDPLKTYSTLLVENKVCTKNEIESWKNESKEQCEDALAELKGRSWPKPEAQSNHIFIWPKASSGASQEIIPNLFSKDGATYMEAIASAVKEQMENDARVYLIGEDVAPPYGNAFMMFRSTHKELWGRFINTPIAENAIVGALVGMAAAGLKPVGEMQFNDFSASAFNQIVNNAAKLRYRTKIEAPFVLRMPYGGLRRAGPFHSQDTIPWFHRAFGLKIVAPSTPNDARGLFHAAMKESDPVLFYEHIALYRDPSIKQVLTSEIPQIELGKAALRMSGSALSIISYGAYVHKVMKVAQRLESEKNIHCDVIDLRSLVPLDFEAISASIRKTSRVLLVSEDSRTGGFMESLASKIADGLFDLLDAPIRVIGSEDTPVPYSPSLEDAYLASENEIFHAAVDLVNW